MITYNGYSSFVASDTKYLTQLKVGHCTIIGDIDCDSNIVIGENLTVGAFCKIDRDVIIGNNCIIEDNCLLYHSTSIGNHVQIVSGSRISARCIIGDNVIINGLIPQRVIIEDDVRYFGRIAHSHYNHTLPWKTTIEPSPILRKGCMVGVNSLLIGSIEIGENSYISAGEIVRSDIPANSVLYKGQVFPKSYFRGILV